MSRSFREEMAAIDEIADCQARLTRWQERATRTGGKLAVRTAAQTAQELTALIGKYGGLDDWEIAGLEAQAQRRAA